MFIPLHDANNLKHIRLQYVTIGLIAVNILVFLIIDFAPENFTAAAVYGLGYIPSVAFDMVELPSELVLVPENLTYVTYSFLHGDIYHLGGNMLFLWVFGDNVEDALGHFRFLLFYLLCAAAGAFVHGILTPASQVPLIGASGAIAGVVTAYLILHPRVKIWILALGRIPLRIPAYIALVLWIAFQFSMLAFGGEDEISWSCHVGGIIAGAILVFLLRRRGIPVFDREVVTPRAVEFRRGAAVPIVTAQPSRRWGRQ